MTHTNTSAETSENTMNTTPETLSTWGPGKGWTNQEGHQFLAIGHDYDNAEYPQLFESVGVPRLVVNGKALLDGTSRIITGEAQA